MPRKGRVSLEEKVEIVRRCIAGELSIYAARQLVGVGGTTVRRWIARTKQKARKVFFCRIEIEYIAQN